MSGDQMLQQACISEHVGAGKRWQMFCRADLWPIAGDGACGALDGTERWRKRFDRCGRARFSDGWVNLLEGLGCAYLGYGN